MVRETGLYDLLGVSPSSSQSEIQKAFRKLALKWHPDRVSDPTKKKEAEEKFQSMSEAFDILSDEDKRRTYDMAGLQAVREGGSAGGMGGMGGMGGLFDLFGGGMGMGGGHRREPKPQAIVHQMEVSLEDFYTGKTKKLHVMRERNCSSCNGSGARKAGMNTQCTGCGGKGKKMVVQQLGPHMIQQMQVVCPQCKGKGTTLKDEDKCKACNGKQTVKDKKLIEVFIEKGAKDKDHQIFHGEGDQIPNVKASGDIVVVFIEKENPRFQRIGRYLLMKKTISLADALCGFKFVVEHLDKRKLVVLSKPGQVLNMGCRYSVHREGMPVKGTGGADKGDLIIDLTIDFPDHLNPDQQGKLREILGGPVPTPVDMNASDVYEACIDEFHTNMAALEREDASDDEDDPRMGGGGGVQCAQQ